MRNITLHFREFYLLIFNKIKNTEQIKYDTIISKTREKKLKADNVNFMHHLLNQNALILQFKLYCIK